MHALTRRRQVISAVETQRELGLWPRAVDTPVCFDSGKAGSLAFRAGRLSAAVGDGDCVCAGPW
jgi:hypothetical protein